MFVPNPLPTNAFPQSSSLNQLTRTKGEPQNYMFTEMRSALGIPKSVDILDHIYSLPTLEEQQMAHEKIRIIERRAMLLQKPQAGVLNLMRYLDERKVRKGICTRNFDSPVNHPI